MSRPLLLGALLVAAVVSLLMERPRAGALPIPTDGPGEPAGNDDWFRAAREHLERSEYEISVSAAGLQAPNREQNLRAHFGEAAIEVVPRSSQEAPRWRFGWRTVRWGRPGAWNEVTPASPVASGTRVTYAMDGFEEWYENKQEGLEQGFTIARKPTGAGNLRIEGKTGPHLRAALTPSGDAVNFLDENDALVLRYGELHVWDVEGDELPAHLALDGQTIALVVDDSAATYPLTVDPLISTPSWSAEGNEANAQFGGAVATAGDVNGDGFSDVIVGAATMDGAAGLAAGRAFVYLGSANGLSTTPVWTAEGDNASARLGVAVATAGDVNGDGYDDIIVGATYGGPSAGRALVYLGSASGPTASPAWTAEGEHSFAVFGQSVGSAGDVDGDGYDDIVVGSIGYPALGQNQGKVYVYSGSPSGPSTTATWTYESGQTGARLGSAVGTAGDVNSDGYADVIVGADGYSNGETGEGRAFVFHGGAGGLSTAPDWTAESDQASAEFGAAVGTAGDVNGDGYADVIVGAPLYDRPNPVVDHGRIYLYYGSATGLAPSASWTTYEDHTPSAELGSSVGTVGDVNGDGYSDVIVGAPLHGSARGVVRVYAGSPAGPFFYGGFFGSTVGEQFGTGVAAAGDVNGDGFSDVIVGASLYGNGETNEGRAVVFLGCGDATGIAASWTAQQNQPTAQLGWSVATAGDVNGDGYSDVIVGAPTYDNGESDEGRAFVYLGSAGGLGVISAWSVESDRVGAYLGNSVSTAGDVNGDGYSDVIVGAYLFDGGQYQQGKAYVYLGSAGGLAATPDWTVEGDATLDYMGWSVATAGDVNGDGYADVIVGAPGYDAGESVEGRALVYVGGPDGLAAEPIWAVESNQPSGWLGRSVAGAGDVNGDGYGDVLVGAPYFDTGVTDGGAAFLYLGSGSGVASSPAWTQLGGSMNEALGTSVAAAGDVNGDGFGDVVVGGVSIATTDGLVSLFAGSVGGLASVPLWTLSSPWQADGLGWSVAGVGDIDGDGYSDIAIGAPHYGAGTGRLYTYHGSPQGPGALAARTLNGQPASHFGWSVAGAGDVNGDGFADLIIGSYDGGTSQGGIVEVFDGGGPSPWGGGAGLPRAPQQRRADDSAPIALLGRSDSASEFLLSAFGHSPGGRGRVRLQAEVKPAGVLFDGQGLIDGPWADTGVTGAALTQMVSGLTEDTPYHWRLRIVRDSPLFPYSPWLSPPGNGANEADLRTGALPTAVLESPGAKAVPAIVLAPPAPNPLVSGTRLQFTLPSDGAARVTVYDVGGRTVAVLSEGPLDAGWHEVRWNGRTARGGRVAAGVYFVRLEHGGRHAARKVIVTR